MSYPIRVPIGVQWGDMDALGHVNNARYFTWFETARIALFEAIGLPCAPGQKWGPILATISCDFLEPLHYPARIEAGAAVKRIGTTSFAVDHAVLLGDEVIARGDGVVVLVDYAGGGKVPVPPDMRLRMEDLIAS